MAGCYIRAMSAPDHSAKSRVAAISIFASATMAAAKLVVGVMIGSLALINNTTATVSNAPNAVTNVNTAGKTRW